MGWDSGERIGALMGIEWSDVDLKTGHANFRAEVRKGRRKPNLVKLAPDTIEALKRIRSADGPVFPFPFNKGCLWAYWKKIIVSAGLPPGRFSGFHCLRRSVASHFEAQGGNATALLGHSSRRVTEVYLDPRIVVKPNAVDLLFRPDEEPNEDENDEASGKKGVARQ